MSSFLSSGTIPLRADEAATVIADEELGYPFEIPKVFLDGTAESYYPQVDFSWGEDTVVVLRGNCLTAYTKSSFAELLAEDENGNVIWMDGRSAPYEGCWSGKYLNKTRGAQVFTIAEYNLATTEKKTYKVVQEGTAPFDEQDLWRLSKFVDSETLGNTFEVKDGVLVGYNGVCDDVQIPDSVTSIGWRAFDSHNTFTRIRIPKTVAEIDPWAFQKLTIAHIEVDSDNPRYYCRDGLLIDKQTKAIICGYAGDTIPNDGSVITIGSNAFYGRTDLKYMEIPDSVTEIGDGAFSNCINLEKVVMSDLITVIGKNAFAGCERLTEINLPSSITKISSGLFSECAKLKSVIIPDTVKIIEDAAFHGCTKLEQVDIPIHLISLGKRIFGRELFRHGDGTQCSLQPMEKLSYDDAYFF